MISPVSPFRAIGAIAEGCLWLPNPVLFRRETTAKKPILQNHEELTMNDLAQRFAENPILRPQDLRPSLEGMEVTCLLNPGVFRFEDKTWLLVRVAERPRQIPGKT